MIDSLSLQNPHDHFFKILFSDPEKVKSFLQGALPKPIIANLNFDTLEIDPSSYIDQQLQEFFADIVYTCRYKSESQVHLAFLFEHKSYVPQRPHLQLLRYMLNIWEQRLKEGQTLLPIVPMIIYHGKDRWQIKRMEEYFEREIGDELSPFLPSFDYVLTNLQEESGNSIRSRFQKLSLQMGFLLMKWVRDESLLDSMEEILEGMESLHPSEQGEIYLEQIFVYLLTATVLNPKIVMDKARKISHDAGEFANTAGMKLIRMGMEKGIEEGRRKGIIEGIQKGKIEGMKSILNLHISKMLLKQMDISLISEITEVSLKEIKAIQAKLKKEGKLK
ncbi:MAG: Rpn family recombination-promoting nuclease/putative transposase [Bacteroidota bacterium]